MLLYLLRGTHRIRETEQTQAFDFFSCLALTGEKVSHMWKAAIPSLPKKKEEKKTWARKRREEGREEWE